MIPTTDPIELECPECEEPLFFVNRGAAVFYATCGNCGAMWKAFTSPFFHIEEDAPPALGVHVEEKINTEEKLG